MSHTPDHVCFESPPPHLYSTFSDPFDSSFLNMQLPTEKEDALKCLNTNLVGVCKDEGFLAWVGGDWKTATPHPHADCWPGQVWRTPQ